jgi:hypothetical protein
MVVSFRRPASELSEENARPTAVFRFFGVRFAVTRFGAQFTTAELPEINGR